MLCQQCNERQARVHLNLIVGDKITKRDLCKVCGAEYVDPANVRKAVDLRTFAAGVPDQMISQLMAASSNYALDAYQFVRAGLDKAQKNRFRSSQTVPAQISGAELLEALRELAVEQFGKRAKAILNKWGIFKCEDFGEIVFKMVEAGISDQA